MYKKVRIPLVCTYDSEANAAYIYLDHPAMARLLLVGSISGFDDVHARTRRYTSMCEPRITVRSRGRPKCSTASAVM
jgi:hypothetical protein